MALQPFVGPWPFFKFLILYTVGRTSWTGDQPVARPLPIHGTAQTQNKRTQTSMPRVGFEPTIPVFQWANTFHILHREASVICRPNTKMMKLKFIRQIRIQTGNKDRIPIQTFYRNTCTSPEPERGNFNISLEVLCYVRCRKHKSYFI
jgi:hypothetical protein